MKFDHSKEDKGRQTMSEWVLRAEHCAEMAKDADTKKEADQYWKEYRYCMRQIKPGLFPKKKPIMSNLKSCLCGGVKIKMSGEKIGNNKFKDLYLECKICGHKVGPYKTKKALVNNWNKSINK